MAPSVVTADSVLPRLRRVCLGFPGAAETITFGHPTFQVHGKTFTVLEEYKGELSICVKVGQLMQDAFLADERFYRTPYVGRYGWVSLKVSAAPLKWGEIRALARGSYDLIADEAGRKKPRKTARKR
jgi:predicted DNA-binding protein (MmcQ/YjbR family)